MRPCVIERACTAIAVSGVVALAGLSLPAASADAELSDLATRVAFGFYAADDAVLRAAEKQLERLPARDEPVRYLRALAALRRAQLELSSRPDADVGDLLERCVELAEPAEEDARNAPVRVARVRDAAAAEAWTLAAACAAVAAHVEPLRSGAHGRRRERALARARAADPTNPRVALVAAWAVSLRPAAASDDIRAAAREALEKTIAAFAEYSAPSRRARAAFEPDWGEAEALALLAEIRAREGARREARDLIERALLAAPGYAFAEAIERVVRGED
jgi:hypothetical protein